MKLEFKGDILSVRAVEDCIRATKKYTEGIETIRRQHPIQGEEFGSKVFCKYYEVYPNTNVSWDMPAGEAWAWVWGDTKHIDVIFYYDYRDNKAAVITHDGNGAIEELKNGIPYFKDLFARLSPNGKKG